MYTSYGFMEKSIKSLSLKYKNSLWATQNTPFNLSIESGQNSNKNKKVLFLGVDKSYILGIFAIFSSMNSLAIVRSS